MKSEKFKDIEYQRNHKMVRNSRGPASHHYCFFCIVKKACDWAQIHNTDGTEPIHYVPSCRSCHIVYDGHGRNGKNAPEFRSQRPGYTRMEEHNAAVSAANTGNEYWLGKKHTVESRKRMSVSQVKTASTRKRDQFGRWALCA